MEQWKIVDSLCMCMCVYKVIRQYRCIPGVHSPVLYSFGSAHFGVLFLRVKSLFVSPFISFFHLFSFFALCLSTPLLATKKPVRRFLNYLVALPTFFFLFPFIYFIFLFSFPRWVSFDYLEFLLDFFFFIFAKTFWARLLNVCLCVYMWMRVNKGLACIKYFVPRTRSKAGGKTYLFIYFGTLKDYIILFYIKILIFLKNKIGNWHENKNIYNTYTYI